MRWQDWVFTTGAVIFIFALLPSVFSKDKPALSSSIITGSVLSVFAFAYFTLSLKFSALTTFLSAVPWFVLAFQKYQQLKNKP